MLDNWETMEKQALGELVIWSAALFLVWMRLTDGVEFLGQSFGLTVVEQAPSRVIATLIGIGILAAVGQLVLRSYLSSKGETVDFRDERDRLIEHRADRSGYWSGVVVANLIIGHVLMNQAFGNGKTALLELTTATGITLALLSLLIVQELARQITILWLYRRT